MMTEPSFAKLRASDALKRTTFLLSLLLFLVAVGPSHATAVRPFQTGFVDNTAFYNVNPSTSDGWGKNARNAGASFIRLNVDWSTIAPAERPAGFSPSRPDSPGYNWALLDQSVKSVIGNGMVPILMVFRAPKWAEGPNRDPKVGSSTYRGTWKPNPAQFAAFGKALALRYSGKFRDPADTNSRLPKVKYFQAWNEPNLNYYLNPQQVKGRIVSPHLYRNLLNRFYGAVKSVAPDVSVLAAGNAPLGSIKNVAVAPLRFLRTMTCLRPNLKPQKSCGRFMRADIYDQHLYTSGGPTHKAAGADEVALGDLPKLRRTLIAADRHKKIRGTSKRTKLWSTEFSWDTVPDPGGLSMNLAKRWVAEALYRMWQSGISVMTWQHIVDQPTPAPGSEWLWGYTAQSGFYFHSEDPAAAVKKGSYRAFRFPFVAFTTSKGIRVWGRTPNSRGGKVRIQQNSGSGWKRLMNLKADRTGIFRKSIRTRRRTGRLRAIYRNSTAVPFSLRRVPDRFVRPFGGIE